MILQELNDYLDGWMEVLDGDDAHDVGFVLGVGRARLFVGQNETCIGLFYLCDLCYDCLHASIKNTNMYRSKNAYFGSL